MKDILPDVPRGALEGLNVLDLGCMVAAPYCAMMLANLGAHVIKIEEPGGGDISRESMPKKDGESTYYINYNCSKYSLTLNLKHEEGKRILAKLIEKADVLVENFRPGVMKRLGFSYEAAAKINPGLIYVSISGYGQSGQLADRAAFDPIAQAMSGITSITGEPDGEPVRCGASIADVLAGQNAAFAVLAALRYREQCEKGQWIDIALADSCISAMTGINQIYLTEGRIPGPLGNGFAANAPGNAYHCKDGKIMLLAGRNSEWERLAKVLGCPQWLEREEFSDVAARTRNRDLLDRTIDQETRKYTVEELLSKLLDARLPAGEIYNVKQVVEHPHFNKERNMFVDVEHPRLGSLKVTNLPIHMSETPPKMYKCAPCLGEDTDKILAQLGYDTEEISTLRRDHVI